MHLLDINEIAKKAGIPAEYVEPYGKLKAKVDMKYFDEIKDRPDGKLVLVTAITPTKAGEGKTTTSVALAEGFGQIGQEAMLCLREPSLGPVFGIKGGATGGGKVTVEPTEDINLHFTGDMHALTSSINLISAVIDNSIYQGNPLRIDPERVVWKRAMDMNDRALRDVDVALEDPKGTPRRDHFVITVASEMMAIMCLAKDEDDFLKRLSDIIVAFDLDGKPITVKDLQITHAIMRLMRDALKPNLVQTSENNPALIHGGPFANIAHGCNSVIATKLGLKLAPIVVTEAGFGADLGAEKFLDIKCRAAGFKPDAIVMVATIRALKMHGGQPFEELANEDVEALKKGVCNLKRHLENMGKYDVPMIIAINHFASDSKAEIEYLESWCKEEGYEVSFLDGFLEGGKGAVDLAKKVQKMLKEKESHYHPIYELDRPLKEKINTICREIYRAGEVIYTEKAEQQLAEYEKLGFGDAYICMAKTPQSVTDDAKILGAPSGFPITIREVNLSAGARFVIPLTGKILTMPGLPKVPAAVKMEDMPWRE
ncbi:MAG: formate--tetrahydrofolate ligase [Bacilli bacterium]|jgi:formate--tetrahydrofolate ligase|nr:formate--tetrahydrofolate ligase [Bacilli bacterium]MBQ4183152.1 formate--tetrahydrofolate ligase [Bacilli bacterium]MCR5091868.1 formate--tetrahydrofolate ligase [Bacilli bacterium]